MEAWKKNKIDVLHNLAIPFLGTPSKEMKTGIRQDI